MTLVSQLNHGPIAKLFGWLHRPERAYARWQNKTMVCVAWAALLLAAINPPHGTGITVCWLKLSTGLPCPGCGLTRSLSCALRGMFVESWQYHPLGLFVLALFLATAIASLLPPAVRPRIVAYMESHATVFNSLYLVFVLTFVGFGTVRALIEFAHHFSLG